MRRILLIPLAICASLVLAGCTTSQGSTHLSVGQTICAHADDARLALDVAMTQTAAIADPLKQEAARAAIRISYAALEKCPRASN